MPKKGFESAYLAFVLPEELPLIERDNELRILTRQFQETVKGTGSFVVVSGEAGIGKTRLVREFARRVGREGRFIEARCYRDVGAFAYGPWIMVLRQLAPAASSPHGPQRTETFIPELLRVAIDAGGSPQLLQVPLSGTKDAGTLFTTLEHDRLRLFEAVATPLIEVAKRGALILFFDDLTWADNATVDLLAHLSPELENHSILLVSAIRDTDLDPESPLAQYLAQAVRDRRVHQLHLKPLSETGVGTIVEFILGKASVSSEVIQAIFARTGGNPFFVVELTRTIQSQLDVSGSSRSVGISDLQIPTSVKTVIRQRLDKLEAGTLHTLTSAAIIGREFTFEILQGLTVLSEDVLLDQLEEALRARIVRERKIGRTELFSFIDAQIHDYLVQEVSLVRRRKHHRQIANLIEEKYPTLVASQPETLAFHYTQAGDNDKALGYTLMAADNAHLVYAHKDAVKLYRQALELIGDDPLLVAQISEKLGDSSHLSGQYEEARASYENALGQISKEDTIWRSRLHRNIALTWTRQHQYDESLKALHRAEDALGGEAGGSTPDWQQEWVQVHLDKVMVHYWQGNVSEMMKLVQEIQPIVEQHAKPVQRAEFFLCLVAAMLRRDRYVASEETVAYAKAALAASEESCDTREISWARFWFGFSKLWLGDLDAAETDLKASLHSAERHGDLTIQSRCLTYLTVISRKRGRVEDAKRSALRALEVATAVRMPEYIGMAKANIAWVAWRENNVSDAETNARAAMELLQKVPQGQIFAWTFAWPLMGVALSRDDLPVAIECARSMLGPLQQPLPLELTAAIREAMKAWEEGQPRVARGLLHDAFPLAENRGYL